MPTARGTGVAVGFVLWLLAPGCTADRERSGSPPAADAGVSVVDSDGRTIRLDAPADRVVSLVPSATLTLQALGAADVLVGRTDFDTASWAAGVPSVGGGIQPSLESIVALDPDLVVRFGGSQDPTTPARLDDIGIAHVAIRPDRVEDVLATIRVLGTLVGRDPRADSLVRTLRSELAAVRRRAEGREPVVVAYVLGGSPPWVAGPGTYIDELIGIAGGVNAFSDLESLYAAVSPEQFRGRDIDVILTPGPGTLPSRLTRGLTVAEVSDVLELPGPGVGRAAAEVAAILEAARGR